MICLRKVTRDDLEAVCNLNVAQEQVGLVTPNVMTMAEAQFEAGAWVRAIWLDEHVAGLIAMLRPSAYPDEENIVIRRDAAYLWRLMIGADFQRQGLGAATLQEAKRKSIDWGYSGLSLTVADAPMSAKTFYERYGFIPTGRRLWGDPGEIDRHRVRSLP